MPASYSLYELNEYIKRVIALNFSEPIWVNCEIAQVKEVRGNMYLDLVNHDEDSNEVTAQISANIWFKTVLFLKNKLGTLMPSLLKEGSHVLLKVQVEFNEKYGLKLNIEDIDPSFTIGQMEMNRQKILQRLTDEGLAGKNKLIRLPSVIQRIALISSATAAGYVDFTQHLKHNSYGYKFHITLFQAALQGLNTEKEVCQALDIILDQHQAFDCIVIIRGGGSKLDLAWFDNFNIGAKISKSSLPVLTGIGHDIDSTVTDLMANVALKTPTAVADFLIEKNLIFESNCLETVRWIGQLAKNQVKHQELKLSQAQQWIKMMPQEMIKSHKNMLSQRWDQILMYTKTKVKYQKEHLVMLQRQIAIYDPKHTLKRGFTIVRQNQKLIASALDFQPKEVFTVEFFDQTIQVNTNE